MADGLDLEALPTIDEIKASTALLSSPSATWSSNRVVRVRSKFAVKYGQDERLPVEAETLLFLADKMTTGIPRLYATLSERPTEENGLDKEWFYIVMEYIPGNSILEQWHSLRESEQQSVREQFTNTMQELRSIPSPGYYGRVGRRSLYDLVFAHPDGEGPEMQGPFDTEAQLNNGIRLLMDRILPSSRKALFRQCIDLHFDNGHPHPPVFTHGDLQDRNVLLSPNGVKPNGDRLFRIVFIDWEYSGWFPDYWEYCVKAYNSGGGDVWLDLITDALGTWPREYPMMCLLRTWILSLF